MRKMMLMMAVVVGLVVAATGCTHVRSAQGGNTSMTNEAWFTETTGLGPLLPFSTRVYYCPAPGSGGAATCIEAEMVEEAQPAPPAAAAPAPAPAPADEATEEAPEEGEYNEGYE